MICKLENKSDFFKRYGVITFGTILSGFSVGCFLAPNNIIPGGVSGISVILNHLFSVSVGKSLILINIPVFIFGILKFGKSLGIKTVYATVMFSLFTDLFSLFGPVTENLILTSFFGGALGGIGYGLIFYENATTGGVDIIAKAINCKFRHIKIGNVILVSDFLIIGFAVFIYKNIDIALYSMITLYVMSYALNTVLDGFDFAKFTFIITDFTFDITEKISNKLNRGATLIPAVGAYTNESKNIIMCTVRPREIPVLKDIIKSVDPSAFVVITDAKGVWGEGFFNSNQITNI